MEQTGTKHTECYTATVCTDWVTPSETADFICKAVKEKLIELYEPGYVLEVRVNKYFPLKEEENVEA